MQKVPTDTGNRDIERADQLKPGDWIRPGYLIGGVAVAKILFVQPYDGRFRAKVLIVAWGQGDVFPEGEHFDADEMVALALPGEIPEDPFASGRDISEPDETSVPDGVWGEHEGAPAGRTADSGPVEYRSGEVGMWAPTICDVCGDTFDGRNIVAHLAEAHS